MYSGLEQQNIDHYEIQRAVGNVNFKRSSFVAVSEDSVYSFPEDIQPTITYQIWFGDLLESGAEYLIQIHVV